MLRFSMLLTRVDAAAAIFYNFSRRAAAPLLLGFVEVAMQPVGLAGFVLPRKVIEQFGMRNVQVVADEGVCFPDSVLGVSLVDGQGN